MIPLLSQSKYEMMRCPASYVYQAVYGVEQTDNLFNTLGTELHYTLAAWVSNVYAFKPEKVRQWEAVTLKTVSLEAAEILQAFWENISLPAGELFDVERTLIFEDFEGTPDAIISVGAGELYIADWKSSHQIIPADTFQSMLYPYLVFQEYPFCQVVTFAHRFLRYGGCERATTWTRDQLPQMREQLERARNRQLAMHAEPLKYEQTAIPTSRCTYCPLLRLRECPCDKWNPMHMSLEDRTRWQVYLKQAAKANEQLLKEACIDRDIQVEDAAGRKQTAGFVLKETKSYKFDEAMVLLDNWADAAGEDLRKELDVSYTSLKTKLKAKKRAVLDQAFDTIAIKKQSTEFKISAVEE